MSDRARWAAVIVNYEAGPLLDRVRRVGARRRLAPDPSSSSSSTTARATGRSTRCSARIPDVRVVRAAGERRVRARREPRDRRHTRADVIAVLNAGHPPRTGDRGARSSPASTPKPRLARRRTAAEEPRRHRLPVGALDPVDFGRGHARRCSALCWPTNRFTTQYRQLDADAGPGPRSSTGCRAPRCGSAATRSTTSADGTSATSCTSRTSICAGGCGGAGWEIAYEPAGVVWHVQGASTARRPYRMLAEHHRSAWRFARRRYTGARALLLPFAAVYLAARGALAMAAHAWGAWRTDRPPASLETPWARPLARNDAPPFGPRAQVPRQPRMVGAGGRRHDRGTGRES